MGIFFFLVEERIEKHAMHANARYIAVVALSTCTHTAQIHPPTPPAGALGHIEVGQVGK
jgi:hypothetical protein